MDSELIPDTEIQNVQNTQEGNVSANKYSWVILFLLDVNEMNPFSMVKLTEFLGTDFPWKSITGEMSRDNRIKPHEFQKNPGKRFYVFAKVQYGM